MGKTARVAILLSVAFAAGCSHTRVNPDGSVRVIGFVSLTLPPRTLSETQVGTTLAASTFGMSVFSTPIGSSVSVGYSRESLSAPTLKGEADEFPRICSAVR